MADYSNKQNNVNDSSAVLVEALQLGTERIAGLLEQMQAGTLSVEGITDAITAAIGAPDAVEKSILYTAVRGAICDEGIISVLEGIRADFEIFNTALMSIIFCEVLNTTADIKSRISHAKDRSKQILGDPTVKKPDANSVKEEKQKQQQAIQVITDSITKPGGGGVLQAILELKDQIADQEGGGAVGGTIVEFDASSMGESGKALAEFIDILKDYSKYINEKTIDQYGEFMEAYLKVVININKHRNEVKTFQQITQQLAISMDYIHAALKSPLKLAWAAELGKFAIHRAASFFKYTFNKAFPPNLLDSLIIQSGKLKDFAKEFDKTTQAFKETFQLWAEKDLHYNITRARKAIKKIVKFFKRARTKLLPEIDEFNKKMPDINTTLTSLQKVANVYKALAVISIAAVPITLLYPVARISISLAKKLIKGMSGLGKTIDENKDNFDKGTAGTTAIYKLVLASLVAVGGIMLLSKIINTSAKQLGMGILAFIAVSMCLAVGARAVGLIAGKKGAEGIKAIYDLVWASLIVVGALILLQFLITPKLLIGVLAYIGIMAGLVLGIWGISKIMKETQPRDTLKYVKKICWTSLILLGTILLIAIISTAYAPQIIKGLLVQMGLFAAEILLLGGLKFLIDKFGGYDKLKEPLKAVALLCATAVLTVLALILLTNIVTSAFTQVLLGILILGGIMFLLIFVMKQMAKQLKEDMREKIYNTFIALGLLILSALATLGLIKLASMMVEWKTLLGVLLVGAIFFGLIWMMKKIQETTEKVDIKKVTKFMALMLGALLLTCLIVGVAANFVNMKWVGAVLIVGLTLLGLAKAIEWVDEIIEDDRILPALKKVALILGSLAAMCLVLTYTTDKVSWNWVFAVIIVGVALIALAGSLWLVNAMIDDDNLWKTVAKVAIILGTLTLACLILANMTDKVSWNWVFAVIIVGVALIAIAGSLWLVNKMIDDDTLWKTVAKVAIILGTLTLACLILGKLTGNVSWNWFFAVLIVGVALIGIAGALWLVNKILEKVDIWKLVGKVALVLGSFLATAYSLHLAQKWTAGLQWETLLQVGLTILGMAFIMWVISKMGNLDTFIKAAAIVGIICGAILAASAGIWALAEASQLWNEHTWEAAGLMFLAVIGFGGMMLTISKMGDMGTYIKSAAVLAILCGAIIAAAAGIWVLAEASQRWTKHTWEAAGLMFLTVIGFGGLAVVLGMPPIAAFAAIGCAILLLLTGTIVVAALGLGVLMEQAQPWNKTTAKSAEYMFDVIKQFAEMAVVLGIPPISIFAAIGVPVLLLLTGGIMAAAAGLGTLAETATTWDKNVKQSAEYMFDIIKQFAEIAVILGTPPISIFAAIGVPILLLLSGAIITASTGLIMLATVAKMMDDQAVKGAQKLGALITNLFDSLDQLPSVITLGKLMLKIPMFLAVSAGLSAAISLIAAGVQDVANMKVATQWDSEGKPVEYRQLNDKDFELAAKNIKNIVTTIGGAIMDLYKADVDNGTHMFEDAWFSDAPFVVVTKSCSKLGEMISKIAKGVAEMANLKVATEWNSEGTPIAYRHLTDDDFNLAARNIYLIVTCLGNAVMDLYNRDVKSGTHMFVDAWFGDNPFVVVTKSCSKLGEMIANIAKGVSDMANLSVADQWNDKGEPIHFRNLVENDFILAKNNVKDIVITFAEGIMELVANPKYKDFFHTNWFKGESDFAKVIKACTNIGQIISNIADGVVKIAAGTYKKYDDKGKEIGTFAITDKMYLQAAHNLSKIVTILIDGCPEAQVLGLTGLGFKYRTIFTDDGSGVKAAVEAVKGVTSFIGQLADAIIKVAGGTYEYTDEKGNKITKHLDDNVIKAATQNVALMMGGLVASVRCIYEAADVNGKIMGPYLSKEDIGIVTKKAFWTRENYEDVDYESSPFAAALAAVKGIIDIVGNMADSVLKMAAGEFNGKQVSTDRIDKAGTIVADIIKPLIGGIWSVRLNENTKKDVMTTVDTAIQIFKKFSGIDINKLFENAPKAETKTVINSIMEQMRDIRDLQQGDEGKNLLGFYNQTNYDTFDSQATIFLKYIDRLREVFLRTGIISNIAFTYKSPRQMFDTMMSDVDYIRLQLNDRAQFSFNLTVLEQFNKVLEYTKKITSMNQTKDIKEVRGLICDINKLDSKKVDQFRSIFDAIRSLAKQLGSIDKLAMVLSNELNAALTELADKLALAGAQIDKADEYQQKRKDNLVELISSITGILDRPIMVTPAPLEIDDSPLGSSPSGSGSRLPASTPPTGSAEGGTDAYSNPGPEGSGYIPPSVAQQAYRPPSNDQTAMLAQALSYLRKMYGMLNS